MRVCFSADPTLLPAQTRIERVRVQTADLPPPESGALMDLLANHILTAKLYHQCRDRHQGLVNWLESVDAVR